MIRFIVVLRAGTCLILAMLALYPVAVTGAQDSPTPTIEPPAAERTGPRFLIRPLDGRDGDYFTLIAEPGTVNELTVVLGNADDVPLTLRTYVNDLVPMVNGGFAVADEEVEPYGTSLWIDYPAETFTFEPGTGIERHFTVSIPDDAGPGQYIAGMALQTAEPIEVEGSSVFRQVIRKTIAVFIIVPGPEEPAFELGEPGVELIGAARHISIPIVNTGNVLVRPDGELVLTDGSGETVFTAPIQLGSIYAGVSTVIAVPLLQEFAEGDYRLDLVLTDSASGVTQSIEDFPLSVKRPNDAPPVWEMTAAVTLLPSASDPVYAEIAVEIVNNGQSANAALELDVVLDGELVETFTLATSLALPQGSTNVVQRYIPPAGFSSGVWTFELRLNVIDPSSGSVTNVLKLDDLPPIELD